MICVTTSGLARMSVQGFSLFLRRRRFRNVSIDVRLPVAVRSGKYLGNRANSDDWRKWADGGYVCILAVCCTAVHDQRYIRRDKPTVLY